MEQRYKIVADRDIPYLKGVLEPFCDVVYLNGASISAGDVHDADALIIRTRTKCNASLLEGSRVRLIATATIGHDHIDMEYCRQNDIEVATSAGCNARAVLQYVVAALSVLAREDGWKPDQKTIGIIGVGNVGSAVKRFTESLGFRILCCDPPRMEKEPGLGFADMYEMLPQCDIVTCHVPLTFSGPHATFNIANGRFFEAMKKGSVFINSSRGEICDEEALCREIPASSIKACIDTWRDEPYINPELLQRARFATPHIAGYSQEGKAKGTAMAVEAVARKLSLPLGEWYPPGTPVSHEDISVTWNDILEKIKCYFDIEKETAGLKGNPGSFERFRDSYKFRREFF